MTDQQSIVPDPAPLTGSQRVARIFFGLFLVAIAVAWAAFWSAGAAMTTETGIWNSMTWAVFAVAWLGLLPLAIGIYLIVRAFRNLAW